MGKTPQTEIVSPLSWALAPECEILMFMWSFVSLDIFCVRERGGWYGLCGPAANIIDGSRLPVEDETTANSNELANIIN